jgi:predicted O-linked N-acetylglucosamine transferase (SPINDLY family)
MLRSPQFGDQGVQERYLKLFSVNGIDTSRIEMGGNLSLNEYFKLHNHIDIALDPFPFNGGTVTCQALWMGVPVITLKGAIGFGRTGNSLLSSVGLPQLIAGSEEEYVAIARQLSSDLDQLGELRASLRQRMASSPLMDGARFTRNLENAYRDMWQQWCGRAATAQ